MADTLTEEQKFGLGIGVVVVAVVGVVVAYSLSTPPPPASGTPPPPQPPIPPPVAPPPTQTTIGTALFVANNYTTGQPEKITAKINGQDVVIDGQAELAYTNPMTIEVPATAPDGGTFNQFYNTSTGSRTTENPATITDMPGGGTPDTFQFIIAYR
jgi:hypothetical protein